MLHMLLQDPEQVPTRPFWAFFTDLPWIDQVGVVFVAVFTGLGIWRGMWWQIVRFLGVIVAIALARTMAPRLQPSLQKMTNLDEAVTHGVAWFSVFLAGLIVATLLGMMGKKTLEAMQLGLFDRIGGAVVGAFTGVVLHSAGLILVSSFITPAWYETNLEGTRSAQALVQVSKYQLGILHSEAKEKIFANWGQEWQGGPPE